MTANCAGGGSVHARGIGYGRRQNHGVNATTGANGSTSGTNFAMSNSQNGLATNITTAVNNNATTGTFATRVSNVVTLSGANGVTVAQDFTSGLTLSGSTLTGGTSGSNTGTNFAIDGTATTAATNLAAAITRNGGGVGVGATSIGAVVTVTATTPGTAGNGITLAESMTNFTWAGNLTGGATELPPWSRSTSCTRRREAWAACAIATARA